MERIQLTTPEGPLDAAVANPAGRDPWPGVVIVHDMISYQRRTTGGPGRSSSPKTCASKTGLGCGEIVRC